MHETFANGRRWALQTQGALLQLVMWNDALAISMCIRAHSKLVGACNSGDFVC